MTAQGGRMKEERFGPYHVEGLLGRGAMGEVHRAVDTRSGRVVALKRLPPRLRNDRTFLARFEREASAAARLRHPHVVPIHDFGVIDDRPFIDMRLIEGTDLRSVLRRTGPLDPGYAVAVVGQIAGALDAAHAHGLVHRDVKPSNVLLSERDGLAYLIDFGLASDAGATRLTESGVAVGTLAYMAPERFQGGGGDRRVDVYALACLLFELLTGRVPYPAAELTAVMHAHLTVPPPRVSRMRPQVPPALDDVIAAGMHKDPRRRIRRAGELAGAARAALRSGPAPAPRPAAVPVDRRRLAVAGLAAAGAAVLVLGLLAPVADPGVVTDGRPVPAVVEAQPAAVVGEVVIGRSPSDVAVSADGRRVYATNRDDDSVMVIDAVSGAVVRTIVLATGSAPEGIAVTPDAATVFVANGGTDTVDVVDVATGRVQASLPAPGSPGDVAVSPDGRTTYVAADDGAVLVFDDATTVLPPVATGGRPRSLAVSADGSVAYVTDDEKDALLVLDTATGTVEGAIAVGALPDGLALSPDARTALVVSPANGTVSVVDLATGDLLSTIRVGRRPVAVAVHPHGRTAFVTDNVSGTLSVIDLTTAAVVHTLPVGPSPEQVAVSPDGRRVYVVNAGDGTLSIIDPAPA